MELFVKLRYLILIFLFCNIPCILISEDRCEGLYYPNSFSGFWFSDAPSVFWISVVSSIILYIFVYNIKLNKSEVIPLKKRKMSERSKDDNSPVETNLIKKHYLFKFVYFPLGIFSIGIWVFLTHDFMIIFAFLYFYFIIFSLSKLRCPHCGSMVGYGTSRFFLLIYRHKAFPPDNCMMCGYDLTGKGNHRTVEDNK